MAADTLLILPPEMAASGSGVVLRVPTPYGEAVGYRAVDGLPVLVRREGDEARALIYAAKELGVRRVLAGERVEPVSPMLEEGDLLVPADVIDLTRLRPWTFFVNKGYGFIKLNPPFCPDLMGACLEAARSVQPRAFRGAVYLGAEGPRDATGAERRMYRQWGADMVGSGLLPEAYLARELELCYAAVGLVGSGAGLERVLVSAAAGPFGRVACSCGDTMRFAREQGLVGGDWKSWLG